jgi:hypothetical protein
VFSFSSNELMMAQPVFERTQKLTKCWLGTTLERTTEQPARIHVQLSRSALWFLEPKIQKAVTGACGTTVRLNCQRDRSYQAPTSSLLLALCSAQQCKTDCGGNAWSTSRTTSSCLNMKLSVMLCAAAAVACAAAPLELRWGTGENDAVASIVTNKAETALYVAGAYNTSVSYKGTAFVHAYAVKTEKLLWKADKGFQGSPAGVSLAQGGGGLAHDDSTQTLILAANTDEYPFAAEASGMLLCAE